MANSVSHLQPIPNGSTFNFKPICIDDKLLSALLDRITPRDPRPPANAPPPVKSTQFRTSWRV